MRKIDRLIETELERRKGDLPSSHKNKISNLSMDKETYKLRRKVMKYIYEAKKLLKEEGISLPRITVRITELSPKEFEKAGRTVGLATLGKNEIWIPRSTIEEGYPLKQTVFHEILHAVYGISHENSSSSLMNPSVDFVLAGSDVESQFKRFADKFN